MNADDSNGARFHVGSTIAGRYRVERPIGEGAMGSVALARHVSLDETVAIKFLRPELRRDPVATARLAREAKALARIKSDHVARVLDVGVTLSVGPYMVMEYLEGVDLGQVLDTEGPLTVPRAVECVLQVCEALTVAHTAGIIHRDIKPQNLFLARHGRFETLKILDFGIAEDTPSAQAHAGDAGEPASSKDPFFSGEPLSSREPAPDGEAAPSSRPPSTAAVFGTPSYMAPERVHNDPEADHRSDIWSVGVVLHELLTGRAIFDADSITETCARIVSDEPIVLEQDDATLPPSLRAIIARCIERDPARRYQSVEELAAALAPLATMHERFRGRSTGAFSQHLMEEELALRHGLASARWSRVAAAPGTWQHAAASLHAWGARLWASPLPRYAGLGTASLLLGAVGIWLAGIRWMAPPPSELSMRAEPASAPNAMSDAIVESVLPLETPRSEPTIVSTTVSTTGAVASSARDAATADERASTRRQPIESRARPTSSRRASTAVTRAAGPSTAVTSTAASSDKHEGGSSSNGRSRVRLVKDRQRPAAGQAGPAATRGNDDPSARDTRKKEGSAKRDGSKKARSVPARSHALQPNAAAPKP
jgi:serine/threonine protein kinase